MNSFDQSANALGLNTQDVGRGMIHPKHFASKGSLTYVDDSGQSQSYEVEVRPRGMSRRDKCQFKPLKVYFPKNLTHGYFAHTYRKVKLAVQCNNGSKDVEKLQKEYLFYQARDAFGGPSLKARQVEPVSYTHLTLPTKA